jgi:hypothetical protein
MLAVVIILNVMNENELRQDFFISDDGYINIRLKVTTEDKIDREKIVADLMRRVYKKEGFELLKNTEVDQMYFLKDLKKQIIEKMEIIFDEAILR